MEREPNKENEMVFSPGDRWTCIPAYEVVGHRELTEEEKRQGHEELIRIMKEFGADTTGIEEYK